MQITNTLRTTLRQNYFQFNNKIYRQTNGLGMGSPTSAILMEVFMQNVEEKYIQELKSKLGVSFYARYVDDIICVLTTNNEELVLEYLNKQHGNIKFTMETEKDGGINYLDLTINIDKEAKRFNYDIYRKSMATDTVIHNTSNHPQQHKNAALRHLVHRLERTPLTQEANKRELEVIYNIAANNGYKKALVDKLRRTNGEPKRNNEKENNSWTTITYTGKATYKLANFFKKYNINTAFKTSNNLGRKLRTNINSEDPFSSHGVYKLTCGCQHSYIGQTGRQIRTRFREHIRDYNKKTRNPNIIPESNFANHMVENECSTANINKTIRVLHIQEKSRRLNVLENMEIYKQKTFDGRIINEQINTISDTIFEPLKLVYRKQLNHTGTTDKHTPTNKHKTINTPKQKTDKDGQRTKITDFYLPQSATQID
ncbi:uncharacterized protein [Eurosta solidaginis]|uniref:uncharacterized protein isoform X1 n=1 Tax=Eurosta solidaginis TaxID=178769 RepID=UPI003530BF63